jgi:hypothetical protein
MLQEKTDLVRGAYLSEMSKHEGVISGGLI